MGLNGCEYTTRMPRLHIQAGLTNKYIMILTCILLCLVVLHDDNDNVINYNNNNNNNNINIRPFTLYTFHSLFQADVL